jgi:hypothetical protein
MLDATLAADDQEIPLEEGARLLFLMNRFSQGDGALFDGVVRFVALTRERWRMSEERRKAICDSVRARVFSVAQNPELHRPLLDSVIENELQRQLQVLSNALNIRGSGTADDHILLEQIAELFAEREFLYLCRDDGRLRTDPHPKNPHRDPFMSYLCAYVLQGQTAGHEALDAMCQRLRQKLAEPQWLDEGARNDALQKISAVVAVYNTHHPQSAVVWEHAELATGLVD